MKATSVTGTTYLGLAALTAGLVLLGGFNPPPATAAVAPCFSAGSLDFNGDGFADAVVGDPDATVGGQAGAGRITVLYGDADGRLGEGSRQTSPKPASARPRRPAIGSGPPWRWPTSTWTPAWTW